MIDEQKSDEELMEAYQMGSEAAFTVLFQRHSGRVSGFLSKRLFNQREAQDLLQEVFFKLHRSRHLYNTTLPFSPWLFSVTRSVLLDHCKKPRTLEDLAEPQALDRFAAPAHPEVNDGRNEKILGTLSGAQRKAVQLRIYDEATFEEIASKLSTSPENARQLVSRGIKQLRRLWTDKKEEL